MRNVFIIFGRKINICAVNFALRNIILNVIKDPKKIRNTLKIFMRQRMIMTCGLVKRVLLAGGAKLQSKISQMHSGACCVRTHTISTAGDLWIIEVNF